MKSRMRALPSFSNRGTTSTSTSLVMTSGPASCAARMPVSPPMLAPISTVGPPIWYEHPQGVGAERFDGVVRGRASGRCRRVRGCRARRREIRGRRGPGRCSSRSTCSARRRAASEWRPSAAPAPLFHSSADQREVVRTAERDGLGVLLPVLTDILSPAFGHTLPTRGPASEAALRGRDCGRRIPPRQRHVLWSRWAGLLLTESAYGITRGANTWQTTKLPPTARRATLSPTASAHAVTQVAEVEDGRDHPTRTSPTRPPPRTTTPRPLRMSRRPDRRCHTSGWRRSSGWWSCLALAELVGWLGFRAYQSHQADAQRKEFLAVGEARCPQSHDHRLRARRQRRQAHPRLRRLRDVLRRLPAALPDRSSRWSRK